MKRPASIPAIGCLYIGCGSFLILGVLFLLLAGATMRLPNAGPDQYGAASNFVNNFALSACLPLCPAILLIFAGSAFLRLRPWSRALMETIAWLAIVVVIGYGISSVMSMYSLATIDPDGFSGPLSGYYTATTILTFGAEIALVIPIIIIIFILRSRGVREAIAQRQG